jgi:hypothetical protein
MPLSWNEIKSRAQIFVKEWENESNEDAEAKSFWDDFFRVFGVQRRRLASFEYHVKKLNNKDGFVDLFWPGTLIVEHKSKGKSLDKAHGQVLDYFHGIPDKELPKYILVSDFANFRLYDLDNGSQLDFPLSDLTDYVHLFGFIAGYQKRTYKAEDPVNIKAAEIMGKLHDKLKAIGYDGHHLEVYLVRLLFCLFADDTGIFEEKGIFNEYLEFKTSEDGNDLASRIAELFQVLNTPKAKRYKNIDETLNAFPYVNGKLFEEPLPLASFDSEMRKILLDCCILDWGKISPAIFGSLFQSVMDEKARRNLGAHYTSEKNILKVIKPLFLDDLWKEFHTVKNESKPKLLQFHEKISKLRFLDPACGCGNFLIIAYREIRLLEIEIIKVLLFKYEKLRPEVASEAGYNVGLLIKCDVDKFYGIEYEEFPAQITQVAMWLIDHQMNQLVTQTFGEYYVRLPLRKSATIINGNALRIEWQTLLNNNEKYDFILGNPPFIGKTWQNVTQREDLQFTFNDLKNFSDLDYVSAWYKISCDYLNYSPNTHIAFVSTNSITQGEQVLVLWPYLVNKYKIEINFAHTTFKWNNEARGNANVHVVIIGFSKENLGEKTLYRYDHIQSDPTEIRCKHINPYLIPTKDVFITKKQKPITNIPEMRCGNKPSDGGFLILSNEEKEDLLSKEPKAEKFIKKFIGSDEFINNGDRWCIWLDNIQPNELRALPLVLARVNQVKEFRLKSTAAPTRKAANTPYKFFYISQPEKRYIVIPEVSSERRQYVPLGIVSQDIISSNKIFLLSSDSLYLFGGLSSLMHMAWLRVVAGRMKSDYSYSGSIVYNNFPWPENPTEKQIKAVEDAAQNILDVRAQFADSSLADLYDPNTMPHALLKAHQALDKAIDLCYRPQPFPNETKRIEFLFELYDKYTAGLFTKEIKSKTKKQKT